MSGHVLTELGVQLGLCDPASPETRQLAHDYFTVTQTMKEKQKGEEGGRCWTEVSRRPQRPAPLICLMHVERLCCAVQMLSVRPHCTLRRFLLTLLALPTSLCRQQVFAKVSVSCVSGCFQVVAHPILNTMFQEHHGGNKPLGLKDELLRGQRSTSLLPGVTWCRGGPLLHAHPETWCCSASTAAR